MTREHSQMMLSETRSYNTLGDFVDVTSRKAKLWRRNQWFPGTEGWGRPPGALRNGWGDSIVL